MAIFARTLAVHDYRSFPSYELELDEGVNVLVGRNAAGKTNLVEAMQLLTAAYSFRHPAPAELVREGAARGSIALSLEGDGRVLDMGCTFAPGKKTFTRNGKNVRAAGVRGVLPSVLFCPDHLDMVKRSASVRRAALDEFGCQLNERYAHLSGVYARTLEQRNSLLRSAEGPLDPVLLAAWDEALSDAGAQLMLHRMALLGRVRAHFIEVYGQIAPGEEPDVVYETALAEAGEDAAALGRDALKERFLSALAAGREDEARRCLTLTGPHRDEIAFSIDGRPARAFGSQGQQRSIVLAWKIAEVMVTRDILGRYPILLLDDVMSELDAGRREAIVRFIQGEVQTVITTTNLGYFGSSILDAAKVVHVGDE